jgi:hypothetical protein
LSIVIACFVPILACAQAVVVEKDAISKEAIKEEAPAVSVQEALNAALAAVAAQAAEEARPVPLDMRQIESIRGIRTNFVKKMSQTFSLSRFKYEPNSREFTGHLGIFWGTNSSQQTSKANLKTTAASYFIASIWRLEIITASLLSAKSLTVNLKQPKGAMLG